MEYQVLSRKYRPQNFNEIVGQSHIVDTLVNSIKLNRIAHGYLFSGLRGVGKTTAARVFAKALNCLNIEDNISCQKCQNCIEITESRSLDVIELDGASNRGIDEIREIKETAKYPPISSLYKIFIIDEVHMLTKEAFNALLKTLEEPPKNVVFILATTNPFKIPDTILSRVLRFDFKKFFKKDILNHLVKILDKENIKYEELALETICLKAEGSMRDGLSILDKIISYSHEIISYELVKDSLGIIDNEVYLNILNYISFQKTDRLLDEFKNIINSGYDIHNFTSGFLIFLSNCLVYSSGYKNDENLDNKVKDWLDDNKDHIINIDIMRIIDEIQKYELRSKHLLQPEIALESVLIKTSVLDRTIRISELIKNIDSNNSKKESLVVDEDKGDDSKKESLVVDEDKGDDSKKESLVVDEDKDDDLKETFSSIESSNPIDYWDKILKLIQDKDERVFGLLQNIKLKWVNDILIIDLADKGNDFIKKTLMNKITLIEDSIYRTINKKTKINIINNIKQNELNDEQKHPLLEKIKNKFGD